MTDDLVTRLRALADEHKYPLVGWEQRLVATLREAADFLEGVAIGQNTLTDQIADLCKERNACKAKLAEEEERAAEWMKRYDELEAKQAETECSWRESAVTFQAERNEARAEAAALREAAHVAVKWVHQGDVSTVNAVARLSEALSQPGPGAAYQEEHRRLQETTQWQAERMKIAGIKNLELSERVRKLEAVAEAAVEVEDYFGGSAVSCIGVLREALASLKEKP